MKSLNRRIYRERRRLAIIAGFSAVAGYLLFAGDPRIVAGFPLPFLASVGAASLVSLMALIICLLQPAYRWALEIIALTLFIYAFLATYVPSIRLETAPVPILILILFMIAAQSLFHLVYGNWSDNFLRQALHVDRATAISPMNREDLWLTFYPDPRNLDHYFDDTVEKMEFVDGSHDTIHVVNRFDHGLFKETVFQFDQVKPGWSFRYDYEVLGVDDTQNSAPPTYTLVLEPRGEMTAVHVRWERFNFPTRKAMMHWVDDWPGRRADIAMNKAEAQEVVQPVYV